MMINFNIFVHWITLCMYNKSLLFVFIGVGRLSEGPGKTFRCSWKVLEFFVSKSLRALHKKWQKFLHICWGLWAADDFALRISYWGSALIIILFVDVTGYSHFEAPCWCTSVIHFCSQAIKLMLFSSFWTGQLECDSLKYYTSMWAVSGFSITTPKLCLVWPMPEIH